MKKVVDGSSLHKVLRPFQWAILILPIFLCGCFNSQNTNTQAARGRGIQSLSRYFSYGHNTPAQVAAESVPDSGYASLMPRGISVSAEFAQGLANSEIALPGFFGNNRSASGAWLRAGNPGERTPAAGKRGQTLNSADLSILNSSFSQLFSSVFKQNRNGESAQAAKEDLPNPFTEERLKREVSSDKTSTAAADTKSDTAAKSESKTPDSNGQKSTPDPATALSAGAGIRWDKEFLIIGDFDGSGRLSARSAQRSGDAIFVSDDGERGFNVYANYAALDQQSSFYIDDIDGDGITDLVITNSYSLFGGVLLGDGKGGYRIADKFVTGYEPVVPSAGPFRGAMREILTVNTRTGMLKRFFPDDGYRAAQTQALPLLPDFLLHLVALDTSRDLLMAGKVGRSEQILGWNESDVLQPTGSSLGVDPISLSGSFGNYSLQVYQVGNYASVVLSGQGKLFNVANLHISPQTYLVLGDIYRQGFVDVGAGILTYFTPKN